MKSILLYTGNQLNIIGVLPIYDISYVGGEAVESPIGSVLLRQRITNKFMLNFANKTSSKSDLFSLSGKHLAGSLFGLIKELPLQTGNQFKEGELFTDINIENSNYYMVVRPYYHMNKPVFLMSAFASKEIVTNNIKNIFFLQFAGIIVGMIFATIVAFFMERIITKPIGKVTEQMNRIAKENRFDQRIIIESNDEIGRLAGSFNNMTAMLEMEVEKRTEELTGSIKKLQKSYDELQTAYKKISELEEIKTSFVSTVSHELRTPLTSVIGFAMTSYKTFREDILPVLPTDSKELNENAKNIEGDLAIIVSEGERLSRLINDVLDIAKMEAGAIKWNIQEVDIKIICQEALSAIKGYPKSNRVDVRFEVPDNIRPVKGDPDRLIQVIANFMSNALKFTEQGNVTLNVEAKDKDVKVTVSDTGKGIKNEDLGRVFEKFTQVSNDNETSKPKGTGLGLPICKEIIEHLGGSIWVESEVGKGSCFNFTVNYYTKENEELKGRG
ncbi:MAG: HAMP domain-containing sensor histidine kinase [Candidatus Anammoxibacter sp.]